MGTEALIRLGGHGPSLGWSDWLGALFWFTAMLWRATAQDRVAPCTAWWPIERFAMVGTVLVGVLVLSGVGNLLVSSPPAQWRKWHGHLMAACC
jgi:putative copper resistance protein D